MQYLKQLHQFLSGRPYLTIFLVFSTVQVVLYNQIGIVTEIEASKYIEQGTLLYQNGQLSDTKYIFYLPIISLVWLCKAVGASWGLIVIIQVLLGALSLFLFYKLGWFLSNSKPVAFYSSIALALFVPLQSWNFFLYSESLFISLSIIFTYLVFVHGTKGYRGTLTILGALIVLCFSRPHGLLFIPPTIIFLVMRKQDRTQRLTSIAFCFALLAGMYVLLNTAFTGGSDMDAMKPFIEEHIICFVPLKPEGASIDVQITGNPVNDLFYYVLHNPLHFLRMAALKLLSFFNMTRPYYSSIHNILLAAFFLPVYIFSIFGLRRLISSRPFAWFLLSLLILYPLGATFQCDDWHSRFTMVVFPYFILLGAWGVHSLLKPGPGKTTS